MSHQGHRQPCEPPPITCTLVCESTPFGLVRECLYALSRPIRCDEVPWVRQFEFLLVQWHNGGDDVARPELYAADAAGNPIGDDQLDPVALAMHDDVDLSPVLT